MRETLTKEELSLWKDVAAEALKPAKYIMKDLNSSNEERAKKAKTALNKYFKYLESAEAEKWGDIINVNPLKLKALILEQIDL